LTKLASNPLEGADEFFRAPVVFADCDAPERPSFPQAGRTSARRFSSGSTSAERLSDRRNVRREENKT
jgi:hypothetical protein